jgi:hypothetical protein
VTQNGTAEWQESRIPPNEQGTPRIRPWLDAQVEFKRARHINHNPYPVVGGLRLLVQKWTKSDGILDTDPPIMPFMKTDFDQVMDRLCLPPSFPLDFARVLKIPAEVRRISTRYGDRLGWLALCHVPG